MFDPVVLVGLGVGRAAEAHRDGGPGPVANAHVPAGSLGDEDLAATLSGYRRSVASRYRALMPEELAEARPKGDTTSFTVVAPGGEGAV